MILNEYFTLLIKQLLQYMIPGIAIPNILYIYKNLNNKFNFKNSFKNCLSLVHRNVSIKLFKY